MTTSWKTLSITIEDRKMKKMKNPLAFQTSRALEPLYRYMKVGQSSPVEQRKRVMSAWWKSLKLKSSFWKLGSATTMPSKRKTASTAKMK